MKLVRLMPKGKILFVGDTHGDLEASTKIFEKYPDPKIRKCFLGDYVDRGPDSKGNIDFLLQKRKENPNEVYLLRGNHEAFSVVEHHPADFWHNLNEEEYTKYTGIFEELPLVILVDGIIALHGAIPDISKITDVNALPSERNNDAWRAITWGDLNDQLKFGTPYSGRPTFGREHFYKMMKRLKKNVLIRSHDPRAKRSMFNNKCLTLFSSCAYGTERIVALADFTNGKRVKSVDDLVIETI